MPVGQEWIIDALGCSPERLRDRLTLERLCFRIITDLDLHVIRESIWHQFPSPGGITSIFLLSESHLTCHTYPEIGVATFNLYCCRPRPEWSWTDRLTTALGAQKVTIRTLTRGTKD
jgi:S-adenosylmethionine decarboxylase